MTRNDLDSSANKVKEIEKDTGIRMVLVDATEQKSMPNIINIFEFAENLPRTFKFAILISEKQATKNGLDFLETVACNRGIKVKEFSSKEKAIEWLKL